MRNVKGGLTRAQVYGLSWFHALPRGLNLRAEHLRNFCFVAFHSHCSSTWTELKLTRIRPVYIVVREIVSTH
jgi:hypothetical protein